MSYLIVDNLAGSLQRLEDALCWLCAEPLYRDSAAAAPEQFWSRIGFPVNSGDPFCLQCEPYVCAYCGVRSSENPDVPCLDCDPHH